MEKKMIQFVINTPMLTQIGCKLKWTRFFKPYKLITTILASYIFFHFLCSWKNVQSLAFDFKFYILQRFNVLVESITH
jgi:hypothetical protein